MDAIKWMMTYLLKILARAKLFRYFFEKVENKPNITIANGSQSMYVARVSMAQVSANPAIKMDVAIVHLFSESSAEVHAHAQIHRYIKKKYTGSPIGYTVQYARVGDIA